MTNESFLLRRGSVPLLISIPHLGGHLPEEIRPDLSDEAALLRDTDWHLDRLYRFAEGLGASMLCATVSRYAIDANRPPDGKSLYPGQTTTALCPTETFRGVSLYLPGREPDAQEVERRRLAYWAPYHDALKTELMRLRLAHGEVLLWEAHSIASQLPRLFEGKLPDLNFGTNSGASCGRHVIAAVLAVLGGAGGRFTHAVDARFKGGFITRRYGRPQRGIHAIQLEMCQSVYMDEAPPFEYRADLAREIQPLLGRMLEDALAAISAPARLERHSP